MAVIHAMVDAASLLARFRDLNEEGFQRDLPCRRAQQRTEFLEDFGFPLKVVQGSRTAIERTSHRYFPRILGTTFNGNPKSSRNSVRCWARRQGRSRWKPSSLRSRSAPARRRVHHRMDHRHRRSHPESVAHRDGESRDDWYRAGRPSRKNQAQERLRADGHSLGARVIYYALSALSTKRNGRPIKEVYLLGGAVGNDEASWRGAASAVVGNIYNLYSDRDRVLAALYKMATAGQSAPSGTTASRAPLQTFTIST